jgi:hypothetical protein
LKTIAYYPARRPPQIALEDGVSGQVITTEKASLAGTITGRKLRDMYIVHDDEKIFFRSGPPQPKQHVATEWQPPNNERVTFPFRLELKLKEGLNKILVVARLDERVIAYRSVLVSRINPDSTEVAQAAKDKKPKQP